MITKEPSIAARVFISHSHRDRAVATDLQRVLAKFGAQTFLDQDKIQVADVLPDRIHDGIEWCDIFLLIWSSSAAASDWVGKEWNTAYESRRKIVPYCLDSTPLPPVLENLVFVARKDAQLAHAELLRAVFGKGFSPPPENVFPGHWRVTMNAFGFGTATHDLELRANGQITGNAKIDKGGVIQNLMRSIGATELLDLKANVSGTWEYDEHTEILTLDLAAHGFGQVFPEKVQVRITGREVGEIRGKDLSGRAYAIRRLPALQLRESLLQLQEAANRFGATEHTPDTIQQALDAVIAGIDAVEEHRSAVAQMNEAELTEQFDKICKSGPVFRQLLAAPKEPIHTKDAVIRALALVIARQIIPELLNGCFPEDNSDGSSAERAKWESPCPCGSGRKYKNCHGLK